MAFPKFAFLYEGKNLEIFDPKGYFPSEREVYARLKQFVRYYARDGKATPIYGLWRRKIINEIPFIAMEGGDMSVVFEGLLRGYFVFIDQILFYKRNPNNKKYIVDPLVTWRRILRSIKQRFVRARTDWYDVVKLTEFPGIPWWDKARLVGWKCWVVARLFIERKE